MGRTGYLFYEDEQLEEPVVELYDEMKAETSKAYLFGDFEDETSNVWLPRSQVKYKRLENGYEVTVPFWLAKKKGMV